MPAVLVPSHTSPYDDFRRVIESVGRFDVDPLHLNLLGIRGWVRGEHATNRPDEYNDSILVLWLGTDGTKHVDAFRATVDPGRFAERLNPLGDAHLLEGQYLFRRGLHKGYPALVQAEPVRVWRDADKDGVRDPDEAKAYSGWFGVNIHAGGEGERVGSWSAGCQVIWGGRGTNSPWSKFMSLVDVSPQETFRYTLVDGSVLS